MSHVAKLGCSQICPACSSSRTTPSRREPCGHFFFFVLHANQYCLQNYLMFAQYIFEVAYITHMTPTCIVHRLHRCLELDSTLVSMLSPSLQNIFFGQSTRSPGKRSVPCHRILIYATHTVCRTFGKCLWIVKIYHRIPTKITPNLENEKHEPKRWSLFFPEQNKSANQSLFDWLHWLQSLRWEHALLLSASGHQAIGMGPSSLPVLAKRQSMSSRTSKAPRTSSFCFGLKRNHLT